MLFGKLRTLVLLTAFAAQASVLTPNAQAGPILDFLFGPRTTSYRPVTTYRIAPGAVYYNRAVPANSCGNTYYASSYTAGACNPCTPCVPQACQPAASMPMATTYPAARTHVPPLARGFSGASSRVGYLPQTSYRSQWVRVPVTSYRPTIMADPTTGMQVSAMLPCTSYQWQLRRMPVTIYRRPFFSRLFGGRAYRVPAATPTYSSMGCSSCPTSSAITFAPSTFAPTMVSPTPATTGGAITTPGPGSEPADQAPSLNQLHSRTQGASSRAGSQVNRGPALPPLPTKRTDGLNIKPVPDPDASPRPLKSIEPPPLLDPRGKTAAYPVRQAWAATPIKWRETNSQKANRPSSQRRAEIKWDTGGWTSLNN
ncbi:MAG: hypothetical protein IH991_19120 [Planctomycetes bacterium]|nr:hypothetical protein [Planctomycetota bacterium]